MAEMSNRMREVAADIDRRASLTLTDFLLARIAEDEENAGIHPSRFRAECEAKRRIVELHRPQPDPVLTVSGIRYYPCRSCHDAHPHGCPTIRALAAVYADHPDFREEWRP